MSVHWPIIRQLLRWPRREVIVDDRRGYRAIEILVGALHIAEELSRRSDARTIGVLLPTNGIFPMALLGGWMLGRTVVPLNYLLKPEELAFVIDDCETDCVVTVEPMLDFLRSSHKEEGAATPSALSKVAHNLVRLDAMDFSGAPALRWPSHAHADDLALLLYTSGTSGRPKGVMLSHGNIGANIAQIREWVEFTTADVLAGVLPQFHTFGLTALTLLPLTAGCKVVYTARFVPAKIVQLIRQHRATALIAIPSMYNALLQVKGATAEDFATLRYTVSGGEPLPAAVFDGFRERFGVTINEGYGLTETSPVTNWCRPHEWRRNSVGRPLPRILERIVDPETGRDLPHGRDGEIRIKGPNVMRGYFKRPEETAAAFDELGFLRTGDIGRMDEDGFLYITGRLKEMLIVGGENVFPREIEEVLNRHPSVKDSGVVGVIDDVRGELPVAFIELREGAAFDESDLKRYCREHLAGYKVPRHIRVLDALPRNPTGKVMRRELKERAAKGR